jgi:hypothetical protein
VISSQGSANRPVPVPDGDIDTVRRLIGSGYALEAVSPPTVGQRVRLRSGETYIEGLLIETGETCRVIVIFRPLSTAIAVVAPKGVVSAIE